MSVTVTGTLLPPAGIGASGCGGTVRISFQRGDPTGVTFMSLRTNVRANCTYGLRVWISAGHLHGHNHFGVTARFAGNASMRESVRRVTVRV